MARMLAILPPFSRTVFTLARRQRPPFAQPVARRRHAVARNAISVLLWFFAAAASSASAMPPRRQRVYGAARERYCH